jgi:hypothetical protein
MEVSGQPHASAVLPPRKEVPVPIGYDTIWAPEPVWMLWSRENLSTAGNRTPAVKLVAYRLSYLGSKC